MVSARLLLNGYFFGGACDSSLPKETILSPVDGRAVGTVPVGGWSELDLALHGSDEFLRTHRAGYGPRARAELLQRTADAIAARRDELAELLVWEIGKPITLARAEVDRCAVTFRLAADFAMRQGDDWQNVPLGPDLRADDFLGMRRRLPYGPVFAIVPYNWPLNLAAHKLAPALAAGIPIVIKPSPLAPLSTLELVQLIHECGAPDGILHGWFGPDEVAARGIADSRIGTVSFTGSARVGQHIQALAGDRLRIAEYGGTAAVVVDHADDLSFAAKRCAWGSLAYAGQICISVQHILVSERVAEDFLPRLDEAFQATKSGDVMNPRVMLGSMIHQAAADKVQQRVAEAVQRGATARLMARPRGNQLRPVLLEHLAPEDPLWTEEIFGPVAIVSRYRSREEAAELLKRMPGALQTGLFAEFPMEWYDLAPAGGWVVGDVPTVRFDALPYGGVAGNGRGQEGIAYAVDALTTWQSCLVRLRND